MRFFKLFIIVITTVLCTEAISSDFGNFNGKVKTVWDDDGRKMTLLEEFSYIDSKGGEWKVPKNWSIDGSSTPSVFWGGLLAHHMLVNIEMLL
jgi:hypothetical protein